MKVRTCLSFVLASTVAVTAAAQSTSTTTPSGATSATQGTTASGSSPRSGKSDLPRGDHAFLEKAAIGGMMEVELGKMAQQKATTDAVKQFATRMVEDHTKANQELQQIASRKNIGLPTGLDSKHRREVDKLSKKSGADFDKAYMDLMVDDHKDDVRDFRKQADDGKDPDLRAFASKTLPVLEQHSAQARSIYDGVKTAGR